MIGAKDRGLERDEVLGALATWFDVEPSRLAVLDSDVLSRMLDRLRTATSERERLQAEMLDHAEEVIRRLAVQAGTDELTGVLSRRAVVDRLAAEISRSQRYGRPLTVLMADVDGLKSVNDGAGHLAGDELLRELARRLRAVTRAADHVGRWGGDEFLIVCPETDRAMAAAIASKLQHAVTGEEVHVGGTTFAVSMSLGVARIDGSLSVEEAISLADAALFRAKRAGRGRWSV